MPILRSVLLLLALLVICVVGGPVVVSLYRQLPELLGYIDINSLGCVNRREEGIDPRTNRVESVHQEQGQVKVRLLHSVNCGVGALGGSYSVSGDVVDLKIWPKFSHDPIVPFFHTYTRYGCLCSLRAELFLKGINTRVTKLRLSKGHQETLVPIPYTFEALDGTILKEASNGT